MKIPYFSPILFSLLAIPFGTQSQAAVVGDYTFDHLSASYTNGQNIPDGVRAEDSSGNRHHAFYGGGVGNAPNFISTTPSGTGGLDFSAAASSTVIIRDDLSDGGTGSPNAWWGSGNTPLQPTIGAAESWTIETIINFQGATGNQAIVANNGSGSSEWWWRTTTEGIRFLFSDGTDGVNAIHNVPGNAHDSNWHHVALVFDRVTNGGEIRTYYDDALLGTTAFDSSLFGEIGNATRDLEIGNFDGSTTSNFNGMMDRLRISNEALDVADFMPVPEPGSLALIGIASCMLLRRRR